METIFQEFQNPFEKETYIIIQESNISFLHIDNDYFIESSLNGNDKSIFKKYISKIIEIIKNTFDKFIDLVNSFFNNDDHITPSDYLHSKIGQIRLSKDIEKVNKQIDEEIIKGSNIIQLISSKTKVDDHVVADFLNRVASILSVSTNTIIKNTVATAVLKSSIKKCNSNKDKINNIEQTIKESTEDLDDSSKEQIQKILRALKDLVNGSIANYSEILSKLNTTGGKE